MAGFLVPFALGGLKTAGATTLLGGGGALLSQGVLSIPGARDFFGATAERIAEGEKFNLDNPDSYRNDPFDYFRSLFTGVGVDKVEESARQQSIDKINRTLKPRYERVKTGYENLGLTAPDISEFQYQGNEGTSASDFRSADRLAQLKALKNAKAIGVDITGLGSASAPAINAAIEEFRDQKAETKRKTLAGELADKQKELFTLQREAARDQLASSERMLTQKLLSSDQNAIRAQELAILQAGNQNAARQDNAAFRRMQQQYNNRRLDMEQENINNKNRMQTIATLMQGLQGVAGAGNRVMPARSYYTL